MKKKMIIFLIVLVFLLLLLFICYLLFFKQKSFTITFDTDGGTNISSIEVKDEKIIKLPDAPTKDGYTFVGWVNENNNIVTNGLKLSEDTNLKAKWVDNSAELIEVAFDIGVDEVFNYVNIILEKGTTILLPVNPTRDGYIFYGWLDENEKVISSNMIITTKITLKAYWIKKDAKTYTISFDTDGGSSINDIVVENRKVIVLPTNPSKDGYVFAGWVDENGNLINNNTIINSKITLKATWKKPYTCPDGCTPIEDGSKCTKEVTINMKTSTACPKGYALYDNLCLDITNQYHAFSIDTNPYWKCNSADEYMYSQVDGVGGAYMWCAKKTSKVTTKSCPNGYTQSGNICKKEETISCKAN